MSLNEYGEKPPPRAPLSRLDLDYRPSSRPTGPGLTSSRS